MLDVDDQVTTLDHKPTKNTILQHTSMIITEHNECFHSKNDSQMTLNLLITDNDS